MPIPFLPTPRHALFLDFDGTLADIAAQPQAVQVRPQVLRILPTLHVALGGALAIVTGRTLADIDRFLAPLRLPVACEHGAQYRLNEGIQNDAPALDWEPVFSALHPLLEHHPQLLLEAKSAGLALHYRQAPHLDAVCRQTLQDALRAVPGAELLQGKCVLEAKPAGPSKGRAIAHFMRTAPFAGRTPLFAGDDVTDEAGFAAVQALGGLGIKVGDGATQARARLAGPGAVREWLQTAAQALDTPCHAPLGRECTP